MSILDYIAEDGSGRLHLEDKAVLAGQATVANQNGVLFLAYMARSVGINLNFIKAIKRHANIVRVSEGRFLRRKGDPLRQSHDNVLAWAWWSTVTGVPNYAREIYDFTKWRFFIYDPHRRYSFDYRCLLQPSHIFTLGLAAGIQPCWLATLWFAGSCVVADHSADYYLKSMLQSDIVRVRINLLSARKERVVMWGLSLMEKRREKLGRWYKEYYDRAPEHPAVLVQLESEK